MEPGRHFARLKYMTDTQPQPQEMNRGNDPAMYSSHQLMLSTPGHLIASLPGALGYYPNEAVALIHFRADCADPDLIEVGQYQAADLGSAGSIHEMLQDIPLHRRVSTVAVIVTRIPDSAMVDVAVGMLHDARDEFGPLIDTCWIVSEVADGTPYVMVFGPDMDEDDLCLLYTSDAADE